MRTLLLLRPCALGVAFGGATGPDGPSGAAPGGAGGAGGGGGGADDTGRTDAGTTQPNPDTTGDSEICVLLFGGNDRVRGPDDTFPLGNSARTLQAWIRTGYMGSQIAASYGRPSPDQGFLLGTVDG